MITNNRSFVSSIVDEGSQGNRNVNGGNVNEVYNNVYDGDSITEFDEGNDLDIESQSKRLGEKLMPLRVL